MGNRWPYFLNDVNQERQRRLMTQWLEMRDRSLPLSYAVTALNRMSRDLNSSLEDPLGKGSDCDAFVIRRSLLDMEERARRLGYPSVEYVKLHAELRTTPRWVHWHLLF